MEPATTEKPVASTPNTPDARSPSRKRLPSGAPRRTSSITVTARAVVAATMRTARRGSSSGERVGAVALERPAPAGEHAVDLLRADDRLVAHGQPHRVEQERPGLRAAEAAVEGDQLLEGAAFLEAGLVEAADHDVGDVGEAVRPQ